MVWGGTGGERQRKGQIFPGYCVPTLLLLPAGNSQSWVPGPLSIPPTPRHLPGPCTVGHTAGHLAPGQVLFSWLVREIAIGAAGEQKSGQWQGFFLQAPVRGAALSGGCLGPLIYCLAQQEVGSGCLGSKQGMLTSCLEFGELACLGRL